MSRCPKIIQFDNIKNFINKQSTSNKRNIFDIMSADIENDDHKVKSRSNPEDITKNKKRKIATPYEVNYKQKKKLSVVDQLAHEEYRGPMEYILDGFSIIAANSFEELQLGVSPICTIDLNNKSKTPFSLTKVFFFYLNICTFFLKFLSKSFIDF